MLRFRHAGVWSWGKNGERASGLANFNDQFQFDWRSCWKSSNPDSGPSVLTSISKHLAQEITRAVNDSGLPGERLTMCCGGAGNEPSQFDDAFDVVDSSGHIRRGRDGV